MTLVNGLKRGGEVDPVVLLPSEGPLADLFRDNGVPVVVSSYTRWINSGNTLAPLGHTAINARALFRVRRRIRELRPDVIYSNSITNPFGALLAFMFKIPHVWHIREFVYEDLGARFDWGRRLSSSFIQAASSRVVCNSKAVLEKWGAWLKNSPIEVVYNGFDIDSYGACEASKQNLTSKIQLLVMSSLHPGKGVEDAVAALSLLRKRGYEVQLVIAGSEEDKEYSVGIRRLVKELGLDKYIQWMGFVDKPIDLLKDASVLLITSRSEAFGRVAVEAMLCGTPLVGAASGGLKEIIEDGKTGFLYKPGDSESLAGCVESLIKDPERTRGMALQGRARAVSEFDSKIYVDRIQNILKDVCKDRAKT